jgi:hypothetical protein
MRRSLVLAAVLAFAASAAGQEIFPVQFFPVVARGAGLAGTQWVTDLTIHNPTEHPVTVGLQFFPANQDNLFNPFFPNRITLQPGQTTMIADVLQEIFGYTGDIKGGLGVVSSADYIPGNSADARVLSVTRTYNVGSPQGTFGQTVPSLIISLNVGWASSFITGARNDGEFRSNLGIGSVSLIAPIRVHYRIKSSDGGVLVQGSKVIRIASMNQWSFDQLGVGTVDGPLTVELWLDPANASPDPCAEDVPPAFMAYVSKVDNGTGDAEFLNSAPLVPLLCAWEP